MYDAVFLNQDLERISDILNQVSSVISIASTKNYLTSLGLLFDLDESFNPVPLATMGGNMGFLLYIYKRRRDASETVNLNASEGSWAENSQVLSEFIQSLNSNVTG